MNRILRRTALGVCLGLVAAPADVFAGRGGGFGGGGPRGGYGGGGFGGERGGMPGGMGGQRGGMPGGYGGERGAYGGGMGHSPSFSTPRPAGGGAAGGQYANRGSQGVNPYANRGASGSNPYANRSGSNYPNAGAAAGAGYANRNQSSLPNNGAGAAGAAYANRNQSALPNNGAGAAGAAYANRNSGYLPNNGAGVAGAAVGANYANRNDLYRGLGAASLGAGYWNGNYSGGWGMGGYGMGYGGVGAWGTGSPMYGWGYSGYGNPYSGGYGGGGVAQGAAVPAQGGAPAQGYDYSQPLSTTAAPPQQSAADQASATFAQAVDAFKAGQYDQAQGLAQQALVQAPSDETMHQFVALILFAQGKFEQAAAPLYAVLSVGPGWNWTTLSGMYPDVSVYTGQLRNLEAYVRSNTNSAAARFVLGYHYLCQGHDDAAVAQFKDAAKLQPSDTLSAQLAAQFQPAGATQAPAPATSESTPGVEGKLAGKWSATPAQGVTVSLAIGDDGSFSWTVSAPGQPAKPIAGASSLADGVLTLNAKTGQDGALAGKVTWQDVDHFTFRLLGAPPQDPGLKFGR